MNIDLLPRPCHGVSHHIRRFRLNTKPAAADSILAMRAKSIHESRREFWGFGALVRVSARWPQDKLRHFVSFWRGITLSMIGQSLIGYAHGH